MDEKDKSLQISIVVPFYNEEDNIEELYDQLTRVLKGLGVSYELIFIDDGSTDRSHDILIKVFESDKTVKFIRLRKNFGQTAALQAGFDHAKGEVIITMDGDLQHDPEDIPRLLAPLEQGFDIVSGWRKERKDNFLLRRFPSWVANRIMRLLDAQLEELSYEQEREVDHIKRGDELPPKHSTNARKVPPHLRLPTNTTCP